MKRRLIKSGRAYLTSLPIHWVRAYGLNAKDELDIETVGNKLVISAQSKKKSKSIKLNTNNIIPIIERLIPAMYRAGYDEIEVAYEGDEALRHIQDVLDRELIGFEIVGQSDSGCIIMDLSKAHDDSFANLLRRSFLLLVTNAKDCSKALKEKSTKTLKEICERDRGINKLTNFCERLLIKNSNACSKDVIFLFSFVKELENLADEYKYLAEYCLKAKKIDVKGGILLLDKINVVLGKVYQLFYSYNKETAAELEIEMKKLKAKLLNYNKDHIFGHRLMSIFRRLHVLLGGHYCLRLEN